MHISQNSNLAVLVLMLLILSACGSIGHRDGAPSRIDVDVHAIPDAVPKFEPFSRYGNPETYEVFGKTYRTLKENRGFSEKGIASWYGTKFHGRRTSSGEAYDMFAMTAAHKTLPLPTYVKVTNLDNNKQITVKVNDRGPFHEGRIIDLSYAAAIKLGIDKKGTGNVQIVAITPEGTVSDPQQITNSSVFVQVGAYRDQENAENIQLKLSKAEISSDIKPVTINARKQLYRVRVGPFREKNEANQIVKSLHEMGLEEARVFSNNEF